MPALVGRDPDKLDRAGLIRATVESIAENLSDGIIAPLLFLFVGGPVAAMAYKAINTLDSMIGYRDERYLYFGAPPQELMTSRTIFRRGFQHSVSWPPRHLPQDACIRRCGPASPMRANT